jgi:hypothetical protein
MRAGHFWHDPAIRQHDAHQTEAAERDAELELTVQLAHAAALLGRSNACTKALARADELQRKATAAEKDTSHTQQAWGGDERDELRYGTGMHAAFRRTELSREAERIRTHVTTLPQKPAKHSGKRKRGAAASEDERGAAPLAPRLNSYLCRCLVFGVTLEGEGSSEAGAVDGVSAAADEPLAARLLRALHRTAGLSNACRLGLASEKTVSKQLERMLTRKGKLKWERIFRPLKHERAQDASATAPKPLPIKIEIASGTGDWVVAQALADVGTAAWAAIELRHDRVYATLSRMALQRVPNLCAMGGDAAAIVRQHVPSASVRRAALASPPRGPLPSVRARRACAPARAHRRGLGCLHSCLRAHSAVCSDTHARRVRLHHPFPYLAGECGLHQLP